VGLHDLPSALERVEVDECLHDRARPLGVLRNDGTSVKLGALAFEDVLEAGVIVARRLRYRGAEGRRVVLHSRVDASPREIAAERRYAALVAGAREDSFVGSQPARPDPKVDQRTRFAAREPNDARPSVRTGGRVVGVDDPGVRNALLTVSERVRVANGGGRVIPLLETLAEESVDRRPETARRSREAVRDDLGELRVAVVR
jgi:hypothetical protein